MIEWFDDLTLGMRFKSGEVSVTMEDIKRFAAEFDPQPFHLDEAAAEKTAFKGLAASGWHTAAMAMSLAVKVRPFGPHPLMGLGVDGLRWMMPVRHGDALHIEGEVVELTRRGPNRKGSRRSNGPPTINATKRFTPLRPSGSYPVVPPDDLGNPSPSRSSKMKALPL
jgi:acyl dehydratase